MSRAFVSEDAASAAVSPGPERPVTPGPNPVTQRGLDLIEAEIDRLQRSHEAAFADDPARATIDRDLRYWRSRRLSARVVLVSETAPEAVAFGSRVTLRRAGAPDVTYVIVGEDEADPAGGRLSWASPLAEALLGARVNEDIEVGHGRPMVTVANIETIVS